MELDLLPVSKRATVDVVPPRQPLPKFLLLEEAIVGCRFKFVVIGSGFEYVVLLSPRVKMRMDSKDKLRD